MIRYAHLRRLLALLILLNACGNDEDIAPQNLLPETFRIEGVAKGTDDNLTIQCACDLMVEIDTMEIGGDGNITYRGVHGGDFTREVVDQDGKGIAIEPVVFGDIVIRQFKDGQVELNFPANHNTGVAFWDSVGLFNGVFQMKMMSGEWTCAPFDIPQDAPGIVDGTWEVTSF